MPIVDEDRRIFEELELRLKTLLPEEYRDRYDDGQPVSMGSAGVRYGADGRIAWDRLWGSCCDLALAGGRPHKGALLEPAPADTIEAEPAAYDAVVAEICRSIMRVTDLEAERSPNPGWVRLTCRGSSPHVRRRLFRAHRDDRFDGCRPSRPTPPASPRRPVAPQDAGSQRAERNPDPDLTRPRGDHEADDPEQAEGRQCIWWLRPPPASCGTRASPWPRCSANLNSSETEVP